MMNNSTAGEKKCCVNTRIHEVVLTLLHNAVNSTCIPIIANEQHCNQYCFYSEGTCSGFLRQMPITAPVCTPLKVNIKKGSLT